MKSKYYLHELSNKDKRLFYSQEIFEENSVVKVRLIIILILMTVCDVTYARIIHPLVDGEPVANLFTLDLLGLVIGIAIFSLSFSPPLQKKTPKVILIRNFLNSSASFMCGVYVFYVQFDRVRAALNAKPDAEDEWIRAYTTLSQAIYTLLGVILLTPLWYLKAIVVIGYYSGITAGFMSVGHPERVWMGVKCLMSAIYAILFILLTANFRWKVFLKSLESNAWRQAYSDILHINPSSIAVIQADGQTIYSNTAFQKLNEDGSFFDKLTSLKTRSNLQDLKNLGLCSMSALNLEESKDLLHGQEDFFNKSSATSRGAFRPLHFQTLAELLRHYTTMIESGQSGSLESTIVDGKLSKTGSSENLSYEVIIRPLAEYKKIVVIVNDTTERDLVATLENNNEYKDQLLASVSHELRTPLNGNLGFLQAAIHHNSVSDTIRKKFLLPALRSGKLLSHLINDILDYSHLQTKEISLSLELKSLRETLEYCSQLLEHAFAARGLTFNLFIDEKLPTNFKTDHDRLSQIVLNLLSNALKFTLQGGVTLEVWAVGKDAEIRVKDTGIGIKQADVNKLFEEIPLGEKELDDKKKHSRGAGLGLKIAGRLAKLLSRGEQEIQVESIVAEGSTFIVSVEDRTEGIANQEQNYSISDIIEEEDKVSDTLKTSINGIDVPAESLLEGGRMMKESIGSYAREKQTWLRLKDTYSQNSQKSQRFSVSSSRTKEKKKPVLVVDDDPFNILAVESLLNNMDIPVEMAINGKEAVDKVLAEPTLYKLILMDCQMPIMNGFEAAKVLSEKMEEGTVPVIPIIGCTAFNGKDKIEECFKVGMKEVINKPVMMNKLKAVVDSYGL